MWRRSSCADVWPIDRRAGDPPRGWSGWPGGKRFALILTHDVETAKGLGRCYPLMEVEKSLEFRSSFNFVPEQYEVPPDLRHHLVENGYEVGVHGLTHRKNLFRSRRALEKKAPRINGYLREWQSVGFRAPAMFHNLDWIHELEIQYDTSTFDTDPFEPQPDGVGTIFPFRVSRGNSSGYVELPYTLPQDFTLFVLMREKNIGIWKKKLDWIAENGGMALLLTHPDYMNFGDGSPGYEEYPAEYYEAFLNYVKSTYGGQYWHALPKELARYGQVRFQTR